MLERVRDVVKNARPQGQVSFEEWEQIMDRFATAKKFMSDTNPIYVEMREQLKSFEDDLLENRLREVHNFEWNSFTGAMQRMFITPKKLQDDETVGQIKYIRQLFQKLQSWIDIKLDYEKQEADGTIVINHEKR